jgi:hypothetical protein
MSHASVELAFSFPCKFFSFMKLSWDRAGIILGVIGALISIPKGISNLWQTIPNHALRVEAGTPISLTYDPQIHTLQLTFSLIIYNKGHDSETIEQSQAYLGIPGDPQHRYLFADPDITFKENSAEIPKNLPILKDTYKSIFCETGSYMTDDLRAWFNQKQTGREFVLSLSTIANKSYLVRFAFTAGDNIKKIFSDSSVTTPKTFKFLGSNSK